MTHKTVQDCSCLGSGMPMVTVILTATKFAHCQSRVQTISPRASLQDQKLTVMTLTPVRNPEQRKCAMEWIITVTARLMRV